MKIKNQFILLATVIVAIPVLCALFVVSYQYLNSPKRYLLKGTKEISRIDSSLASENDKQEMYNILKTLPHDIQTLFLNSDNDIIYTTIPELKRTRNISKDDLWKMISDTSDIFFYQFTTPNFDKTNSIMISRIPRENRPRKPLNIVVPLIIFLVILVSVCIVLLVLISMTIFKSIVELQNKMKLIADGNLNIEIKPSEEKIKNNEITSSLDSLEKMRLSLLEAQNKKNKFIMGISHDLRTPVAVIKGYTEALRDKMITEEAEINSTLELIEDKSSQLENMINTLINYVKLNNDELREKLEPYSITQLIMDFSKDAETTANLYKRKCNLNVNLNKQIMIPLDKQLIQRAFENLLSNAIRYTKEDDLIQIEAYEEQNKVYLKVSDSGIGISKEDLPHIFDLFYRATNSRREEGMGIGLSVVKNIIETHGWKIKVDSELNKGTCFTIEIPVNN